MYRSRQRRRLRPPHSPQPLCADGNASAVRGQRRTGQALAGRAGRLRSGVTCVTRRDAPIQQTAAAPHSRDGAARPDCEYWLDQPVVQCVQSPHLVQNPRLFERCHRLTGWQARIDAPTRQGLDPQRPPRRDAHATSCCPQPVRPPHPASPAQHAPTGAGRHGHRLRHGAMAGRTRSRQPAGRGAARPSLVVAALAARFGLALNALGATAHNTDKSSLDPVSLVLHLPSTMRR